MPRSMQTLTLGVALGAAAFAGATFINQADADRAHNIADARMAFVDVFGLVDQLVMSEEDTAARVAFEAQGQQQLQAVQQRNADIQQSVQQNPDLANDQALIAEFQQNQQMLQGMYQEYQYDLQMLIAGQISDAYKKVYEAASEVSRERGIDFVFATRPDSNLIQTDSITGVAQEILARPLIAPAASIDLTDEIREKLGLPEPTATDASVLDGSVHTPAADEDPDTMQPQTPDSEE